MWVHHLQTTAGSTLHRPLRKLLEIFDRSTIFVFCKPHALKKEGDSIEGVIKSVLLICFRIFLLFAADLTNTMKERKGEEEEKQ